jgi:hypothetical protein
MSPAQLDILYSFLHYLIIGVNLFAWIPQRTRKIHLVFMAGTIFSWGIMGFWKGFGYCFLTDWHWSIKRKLGETDLPHSFIQYQIEKVFELHLAESITDQVTAIIFFILVMIAIWQHWMRKKMVSGKSTRSF